MTKQLPRKALEEMTGILNKIEARDYKITEKIRADAQTILSKATYPDGYCLAAAAAVLAAMRTNECIPVSLREYYKILDIDEPHDRLERRALRRQFNRIMSRQNLSNKICVIRPSLYVDWLCDKLQLAERARGMCQRICTDAMNLKLHLQKNPVVFAAAIVYYGRWCYGCFIKDGYSKIPQRVVAAAANVTEAGLRRHFLQLCLDLKDVNEMYETIHDFVWERRQSYKKAWTKTLEEKGSWRERLRK